MEEPEALVETTENENRDDVTGLENDIEAKERTTRRSRRLETFDSIYDEMEVDTDTGSENKF